MSDRPFYFAGLRVSVTKDCPKDSIIVLAPDSGFDGSLDVDATIAASSIRRNVGWGFGKRADPPCGDCDRDGYCTMNCGPALPKEMR